MSRSIPLVPDDVRHSDYLFDDPASEDVLTILELRQELRLVPAVQAVVVPLSLHLFHARMMSRVYIERCRHRADVPASYLSYLQSRAAVSVASDALDAHLGREIVYNRGIDEQLPLLPPADFDALRLRCFRQYLKAHNLCVRCAPRRRAQARPGKTLCDDCAGKRGASLKTPHADSTSPPADT